MIRQQLCRRSRDGGKLQIHRQRLIVYLYTCILFFREKSETTEKNSWLSRHKQKKPRLRTYLCGLQRCWHLGALQDRLTHVDTHLAVWQQLRLDQACRQSSSTHTYKQARGLSADWIHRLSPRDCSSTLVGVNTNLESNSLQGPVFIHK